MSDYQYRAVGVVHSLGDGPGELPLVLGELEWLRQQFESDGNPLWCWDALHLWAEALHAPGIAGTTLELPNWVLQYLVGSAGALLSIDPRATGKLPDAILAALSLRKRGGGPGVHKQRQTALEKRQRAAQDETRKLAGDEAGHKRRMAALAADPMLPSARAGLITWLQGIFRGSAPNEHAEADRRYHQRRRGPRE